MFPDAPQVSTPPQVPITPNPNSRNADPAQLELRKFVGEARSQLSTLTGEVAMRNRVIMENDSYVYGDPGGDSLLSRSLDVPVGHDFTPVNWLRRVAEIHRTQTMGEGFTVVSSYHGVDVEKAFDPNEKPQLQLVNQKKKDYAEARNKLFQAIMRDNGGKALWAKMVENASVIGDSVLKCWFDPKERKYRMEMVEAVEHFYAVWKKNSFREWDFCAFVYQISKQQAVDQYGVPPDVATSPLGMPLAVLSSANVIEYISTQPMVTIMEISGRVQGWKTDGKGNIIRCPVGEETEFNAVIVGDRVYRVVDDPKLMPKFYIFPNKQPRRRPWGMPDITKAAISINQTYIETLSDWRTVANRVNFPKWKALNFGLDSQLPTPRPRKVEIIGLGEGQDLLPLQNPNSEAATQIDFQRQLQELKEAFVRETGISIPMFDMNDAPGNSAQATLTGMKSIGDQVLARRQLWTPIIAKVFSDALNCLALWDDNIKELVEGDDDWFIRVDWPPALRKDDPTWQTMLLNRLISGTISVQTFLERMGENAKEEIDRLNDEMSNPITAAIHGKLLSLLAEYKIAGPPSMMPPKVNVNLRGDITPNQEGNLSYLHGFNGGDGQPFPTEAGPQGTLGIHAYDDQMNQGRITGHGFAAGNPILSGPPGGAQGAAGGGQPGAQPPQNLAGGAGNPSAQPTQPQMMTPPGNNQPGQQLMSQPLSGQATPNSPKGQINQTNQRKGRK